jgi:hypothetical protein
VTASLPPEERHGDPQCAIDPNCTHGLHDPADHPCGIRHTPGDTLQTEVDRLTGVIEQIRAHLADLTAEAEATTDDYDKADALSDFAVIRSLLPSPTDGSTDDG